MRPGPRLVPALGLLCALALFVPLWTPLAWAVAAGLVLMAAAVAVEALLLRRLGGEGDAPDRVVLSVGETETVTLTVRTRATRSARLTVRQPWPALLDSGSTVRHGLARPGESLRLEMPVRATARGRAPVPPAAVAATH